MALELNTQAVSLEQGTLKNTIYDCLQDKEGIQINRFLFQTDQLVFLELAVCPEVDTHIQCLLYMNSTDHKSDYRPKEVLVHG